MVRHSLLPLSSAELVVLSKAGARAARRFAAEARRLLAEHGPAIARTHEAVRASRAVLAAAPRPLRVLVVDDCRDGAELLAELLACYGYEACAAGTGAEAAAAFRAWPADVLILDAGLPGEDGFAVARRLCAAAARRPLLVLHTGFPDLESRARAEGFDLHLEKPVDPRLWADILAAHAARLAVAAH